MTIYQAGGGEPVVVSLVERFQQAMTAEQREREAKARAKAEAEGREVKPKNVIETPEFVEMMFRQVRALEQRVIDDPAALAEVRALGARLDEVVNVAIAANAANYARDPRLGASMAECARLLDISKQSASERRKRGNEIMLRRAEAAGVVRFAERKREKEEYLEPARRTSADVLVDFRARRAG